MTIASQTSRISYTGDGTTTVFAVPFYFQANGDLVVSVQDLSGNVTTKSIGTDYNLSGATVSTGGACTFATAPTSGYIIAIARVPAITQTTSYNNNDPFPAKSHELALDKTATIDQYLKSLIDRAILVAPTDTPPMTTLPPASIRALKNFTFDALGNPSVSTPVTGTAVSSAMIPVVSASTVAIARGLLNIPVIAARPEDYGALGNGVTDDSAALQSWANALRDGGLGAATSVAGYATSATITFMPSTNTAPVQGPRVVGNLKLVGHASLPVNNDLLHIYNPTATTTSQNFYYPMFDSLELSNTTGTGSGVALRGFWGKIGKIFGRTIGGDLVVFPAFQFPSGIPDSYESSPSIGPITGIDIGGWGFNNQIGIGATPRLENIRVTVSQLTSAVGSGAANFSGSEALSGGLSYTGYGKAISITIPAAAPAQASAHEIYLKGGPGDIDAAQNGIFIETVERAKIIGMRMNVEPAGFSGIVPSWPLTCYSFGKSGGTGRVVNVEVDAYITIRPGVTTGSIGTLFDFNNETNLNNLTVNVEIQDQASIIAGMAFSAIYKNLNANSTVKIIQNGVVVYDNTNTFTYAQLPPPVIGLRGVRKCVRDANTGTFGATVSSGGGSTVAGVICNGSAWVVG